MVGHCAHLGVAEGFKAADLVYLCVDELLAAKAWVNAHDEHQVHNVDDLQRTHPMRTGQHAAFCRRVGVYLAAAVHLR